MVMGREKWEGMAVSLRKKLGLREEWWGLRGLRGLRGSRGEQR